jgi:magnesium-transporting ATPase (P-type)
MRAANDIEIMGGVGFGEELYSPYTNFNDFNSPSKILGKPPTDPYLPIRNEPMGRDYHSNNYEGSEEILDPSVKKDERYNYHHPRFKTIDEKIMENRLIEENAKTISEHFNDAKEKVVQMTMGDLLSVLFIVFAFIIIIVLGTVQIIQARKIYQLLKHLSKTLNK